MAGGNNHRPKAAPADEFALAGETGAWAPRDS